MSSASWATSVMFEFCVAFALTSFVVRFAAFELFLSAESAKLEIVRQTTLVLRKPVQMKSSDKKSSIVWIWVFFKSFIDVPAERSS